MTEIDRAQFLRALEGFNPYYDGAVDETDRGRLVESFDRLDQDGDGMVTEAEALSAPIDTPREALSLVHYREALRLTARTPSTDLETRMDRVDRTLLARVITDARQQDFRWDALLHSTWMSTLSITELDGLQDGQRFPPEQTAELEQRLEHYVSALRTPEEMDAGEASRIGLILRDAAVAGFVPQASSALSRFSERYTPLVEGLTPENLATVAAAVGEDTRQILVGENHGSQGAAAVSRALLEAIAAEGRAPDAVVIEAERRLNTEEFRAVMESYSGRELPPLEEAQFRRELRLALDRYDGNRPIGFSHNAWDAVHSPVFGDTGVGGSAIAGRFELEAPTRRWQSYEDLFVSAARHGAQVRFIDELDPGDGGPRDAIMADELAALREDIGEDALVIGAFGWWHVQEVRDEGSATTDTDDRPLGSRLNPDETLSVAVTRWDSTAPQGVDFSFEARNQDFRALFGRPASPQSEP